MFRKSLFTYLVIEAPSENETDPIVDILEGHDRRASDSLVASNKVMVHMRLLNDNEDLTNMLNTLPKEFPKDTKIIANRPYPARISTESKQKWKSFYVPALAAYLATVIGIFMINWKNLSGDIVGEALITSIFPAAAAIFLKIYEEYK